MTKAQQKGSEKNRVVADQFAAKLEPLMRELQANGIATYRGIARELERRGIRTSRGGNWSGVQVRSLLRRLGQ